MYKDKDGKMVLLTNAAKNDPGVANALCLGNCNTLTNPAQLRISFTLDYSERYYLCEASADKSSVRVKWTASVPFAFTDPYGRPGRYMAHVRFKDANGNVVNTYNVNPLLDDLVNLGTDPNCSYNNKWEIYYNVTNIPNSDFASGNTVEADVDFYTDCSLVNYYISSGYVAGPSFSQNGYLPCNRLDKVIVNPPMQGSTSPTTVTGLYTISCTPPSGMQPIDYHQVEYRHVTTTNGDHTWDNQTSPVYNPWPQPANTGPNALLASYTGSSNLPQMVLTTGKWLIRYRNVKTGSCNQIIGPGTPSGSNSNTNGNWSSTSSSLWITEMWDMY